MGEFGTAPCSLTGCLQTGIKRGLCQQHYNELIRGKPSYRKHFLLIFERDAYVCAGCGVSILDMPKGSGSIDHIIPVMWSGGRGADDLRNLRTMCGPCNSGKSNRTPEMWTCYDCGDVVLWEDTDLEEIEDGLIPVHRGCELASSGSD